MAKRKKSSDWLTIGNYNLQESYPSLILGAIVIIILGLLVANFLNRNDLNNERLEEQSQVQEAMQAENEYEVQAGDSLSKISEKFYGSFDYWPTLAQINNIANPNVLYAGITITVPDKGSIEEEKVLASSNVYEVQAGDTLFEISEKVYGDGSRWTEIFAANNLGRLPNGNPLIYAGSTITIPR
jgi:nucleoid-associated protein YgaU